MLERLDYVKLAPRRILDAASGPPRLELGERYPQAQVIALDFSLSMLKAGKRRWFRKNPSLLCGDLEQLPLAAATMDFTWCNMGLHWLSDPLTTLREFSRVLTPEGLLMFSTLGPDTLKELRAAAGDARVHSFTDMHDLGDMLVAAGFNAPVMDMEMLDIAYRDPAQLFEDLRHTGQTNSREDRPHGLTGKGAIEAIRANLRSKATFEVVYGHAWKAGSSKRGFEPEPKTVRVFKRMP